MVVSRTTLRKQSADNTHGSSNMVQLRDEEEAKRHRAMPTPANTPRAEEQVPQPETTEIYDPLFDEPEIEEQEHLVQVSGLQHGDLPETDWALIEAAFPEYAIAVPNTTVDRLDYTTTITAEGWDARGSAVESVVGVKRKHEDTEVLLEVDEVALAGGDTNADSVRLQDETRTQIAQSNGEHFVEPDVAIPRNVTSLASPTISQHNTTLQPIFDDNTTPASPASQLPLEPRHNPGPASEPRTSNAPPNYSPVKARPRANPKLPSNAPSAAKKPRKQPLSPNSRLPDTDESKLWCICRDVDDGEKMILCAEPRCKARWFHFECVGLETSPAEEEEWWCFEHRGVMGRQRRVADEVCARAAVRRGEGSEGSVRDQGEKMEGRLRRDERRERREGGKGVARVKRRKAADVAEDETYPEGEVRSAKKAKKAKTEVRRRAGARGRSMT
jgi:hypothetical protein